jgi:hypothetical protein
LPHELQETNWPSILTRRSSPQWLHAMTAIATCRPAAPDIVIFM